MLNPERVQIEHVSTLLIYIDSVIRVGTRPYTLTMQDTFIDTVDLYRHALLFGMDAYVKKLFGVTMDHLHDHVIASNKLEAVLKPPADNHLYMQVVRRFEGLRHTGTLSMRSADWQKVPRRACGVQEWDRGIGW
jgi:hypothetical protein